jgi:hypothetical protein
MKTNYRWVPRLTAILALVIFVISTQASYAGTVTSISDTMSRQKVSQSSSHKVLFTAATSSATFKKVTIGFPDGFTMTGGTGGVVKINGGSDVSGSGAWTFSNTGGSKSAMFTWTSTTTVNAAQTVELNFSGITNPASNGSYKLTITTADSSPATIDTGQVAVPIATEDQVTVTATVDPTITFTVTPTSIALGTLSSGSVVDSGSTGNNQLTVGTNAPSGYSVSAIGTTLTNGSYTVPFVTDNTVTAGSSEFGMRFAAGTSSSGNTYPQGTNDVGATASTSVVTNTGPQATSQTNVTYKGSITANQAAGVYTATITYLATGNF